ncbi:unnamed protein product, partial [marine sediment metagenome]
MICALILGLIVYVLILIVIGPTLRFLPNNAHDWYFYKE